MRTSALVAALVTMLVEGCALSGGDPDSGADGNCETPGFSSEEIRLGFVYPDGGPAAPSLAPAISGFIARIEAANAAGGIHGRKIVPIWRDDASSQEQNHVAVRELVEREDVFGLVEATITAAGGADYLLERNVPVAGIAAEAFWANPRYRNMFAYTYVFTDGPSVSTFGDYAKARGGTRAAVITSDITPSADDIGSKMVSSLAAAGISTAPGTFVYNLAITDPVQLGQKLRAAQVDTVVAVFAGNDLAEVMRGIRAAGAPVKVVLAPSGYEQT
ncbi:ABC transporter substrate-binding protein, partial [Frankia nepalensis]|uniref:ABC transporter substrate-binding protein n=1 Tax=Frankia nepalensis TaxID=1836974 RepID=UPI001EE407A3